MELAKLTTRFSQNVLDETNAFERIVTDESKLAGLPESARKAARASAESKGQEGYRFTLHAPSLIAVLSYLDDASIRETLWRAYNTRAASGERDNRPLIARILELRREKATLLGYPDFADFVLEERMAKNGAEARAFVNDLTERTMPFFEREQRELLAFRKRDRGRGRARAPALGRRLLRREDAQGALRLRRRGAAPLLPASIRCSAGSSRVVERLYGVKVEPREDAPVWDPVGPAATA